MLNGWAANIPKPAVIVLLVLTVFTQNTLSQRNFVLIDTNDYQPLPDGLDINLSIAASKGYTIEIIRLIDRGANINNTDAIGASPLIYAIANNQTSAIETILEYSPDLDLRTENGESALHIAAKSDYVELAELLIRDSADINISDNFMCTPLHFASVYDYFYMTDLLIYYEAEIDAQTSEGTTPLMAAVWAGNAQVADLLIKNGADVNIADSRGFTPLLVAAQNGDILLSSLLLDAGADIAAQTIDKYDIGSIAARSGSEAYSDFIVKETDWLKMKKPDSADPTLVARRSGQNDTYRYFKNITANKRSAISFEKVGFTLITKFNYDFYTGGYVSFIEPLHKFRINTGIEFKPLYTRVLQKETESVIYQYEDKRYVLYAGLGKEFLISDDYFKGSAGILLNMNLGYMMSSYFKGTNIKPPDRFVLMPSLGVERTLGNWSISCLYEYMQTGLYKSGPHWFKIGFSYYLDFGEKQADLKNIRWY